MKVVMDKDGKIVQKSRNLRGVKEYARKVVAEHIWLTLLPDGGGQLSILFDNGATYQCHFASFRVLRDFVKNWRNVRGCKITILRRD